MAMKKLFGGSKPKAVKSLAGSGGFSNADTSLPKTTNREGNPSIPVPLAAGAETSTPVTASAPASPDSLTLQDTRDQTPQNTSYRERAREQDRSDLESGAARSSSDEPWEVIHSSDSHRDGDGPGPLPNPHPPALIPSRSSSFASLPPGASPPAPSAFVPPRPSSPFSMVNTTSSPVIPKGGSPVVSAPQMLRKKHPAAKESTPGVGGAAAILRTLDPHKLLHSDHSSTHGRSKNDSVESLLEPFIHSEDERDSKELERERLWRERDQEIRESEGRQRRSHPDALRDRGREGKRRRDHVPQNELDNKRDREGLRERERSNDKDGERKEDKKLPWGAIFTSSREKERERDRESERDPEDHQADQITRMIGYLTATASEDWALVLEVCERASINEHNAKEAAKALRREFKYAEPSAQLSAARLWAIMLRNASETFIAQTTSRRFLETLEDVITSSRTSPVVRERLLYVLGAAAYASRSKDGKENNKEGFRGLWRKLKPEGKPDEGIPFDDDDVMFNPSMPTRVSQSFSATRNGLQPAHIISPNALTELTPIPVLKQKPSSRNRVISLDEDIRRLSQECRIGRGNAALLSEALAFAQPEDLSEKDIIKEFYSKCRASQELICAQIPWASALAERSRGRPQEMQSIDTKLDNESPLPSTREEKLLADLLKANEELTDAVRVYNDIERIGVEREVEKEAEERSRKDFKLDRTQIHYIAADGSFQLAPVSNLAAEGSSRSPSPSSLPPDHPHALPLIPPHRASSPAYIEPFIPSHSTNGSQTHLPVGNLAPSLRVPHGPRLPVAVISRSRSPSPTRSSPVSYMASRSHSRNSSLGPGSNPLASSMSHLHLEQINSTLSETLDKTDGIHTSVKPSAKALGKRKVTDTEEPEERFDPDDLFYVDDPRPQYPREDRTDDSGDPDNNGGGVTGRWTRSAQYIYDAAAERTEEWMREGKQATVVNGSR